MERVLKKTSGFGIGILGSWNIVPDMMNDDLVAFLPQKFLIVVFDLKDAVPTKS
jgi:hypothetical protein